MLWQNERVVGIDLGTTNSLVAYMEGDTPVVIPGEDGSNLVPRWWRWIRRDRSLSAMRRASI